MESKCHQSDESEAAPEVYLPPIGTDFPRSNSYPRRPATAQGLTSPDSATSSIKSPLESHNHGFLDCKGSGGHVSTRPNVENLTTNDNDYDSNNINTPSKASPNALMSLFNILSQPPDRSRSLLFAKKSSLFVVWFLLILSFSFIALSAYSFLRGNGTDVRHCRMSYMTPSYKHISSFDGNHTRFASKYSLYLYRERYLDASPEPTGVPVIFIPGNAGSYKQVRAIAAECAHQFYHRRSEIFNASSIYPDDYKRGLDFFSADFGEDLTAFHGKTLLDQAEYINDAIQYILSMYKTQHSFSHFPAPKSVILIGHSMGGMVARTVVTLPNYRKDNVNTILTLAAPHSLPPASLDKDVVELYEKVNLYWEKSFSQELIGRNPLAKMALISIAGGKLDQMISSDHAGVASMVPPTNGFTVYTSSIPYVWSGIDHQAIVWCDQFRQVLARTLVDLIDIRSPTKTKSLESRIDSFRKHLLSGFEPQLDFSWKNKFQAIDEKKKYGIDPSVGAPDTLLISQDSNPKVIPFGQRLYLDVLGANNKAATYFMPLPSTLESLNGTHINLLTNRPLLHPTKYTTIDSGEEFEDAEIEHGIYMLACTYPKSSQDFSESLFSVIDLRRYSAKKTTPRSRRGKHSNGLYGLVCKNIGNSAKVLPANMQSFDEDSLLYYVKFNSTLLSGYDFTVIVDTNEYLTPGFVLAENRATAQSKIQVKDHLWKYFVGWKRIVIPAGSPLEVDVSFNSLWSSLLSYKVKIGSNLSKQRYHGGNDYFTPFMRQYIDEPYESKFHLNLTPGTELVVESHGLAPFSPYSITSEGYQNLHFQIWNDGTDSNGRPMEIYLTVDFLSSLGQLVLHYRTALCILPIFVVVCAFWIQIEAYSSGGLFMSFEHALRIFSKKYLCYVVLFSIMLPVIVSNGLVEQFFYYIEPLMDSSPGEGPSSIFTATRKNQFFLGLEKFHLCFLGPLFLVIATGLNLALYYALVVVLNAIVKVVQLVASLFGLFGQTTFSLRPVRIILIILSLVGVLFILPHQFVFMLGCFLEIGACIKALYRAKQCDDDCEDEKNSEANLEKSEACYNFLNYSIAVLMMMLWIIPINAPVLAVWIRNLAVSKWWTISFGSHHDILSIAPLMVLIEKIATGKMLPRMKSIRSSQLFFTRIMLCYIAFYCLVFGIQRAYWLHNLVNYFAAWLVVIYLEQDLEEGLNANDN